MMTPAQLADLLLNPLAQSHMELLVENIRIAMAYHKNQLSGEQRSELDPRLFTPRLYTLDPCETLFVEHLSNLTISVATMMVARRHLRPRRKHLHEHEHERVPPQN